MPPIELETELKNFGTTEISWYGPIFLTFLIFAPTEASWYESNYFGDTQYKSSPGNSNDTRLLQ